MSAVVDVEQDRAGPSRAWEHKATDIVRDGDGGRGGGNGAPSRISDRLVNSLMSLAGPEAVAMATRIYDVFIALELRRQIRFLLSSSVDGRFSMLSGVEPSDHWPLTTDHDVLSAGRVTRMMKGRRRQHCTLMEITRINNYCVYTGLLSLLHY